MKCLPIMLVLSALHCCCLSVKGLGPRSCHHVTHDFGWEWYDAGWYQDSKGRLLWWPEGEYRWVKGVWIHQENGVMLGEFTEKER